MFLMMILQLSIQLLSVQSISKILTKSSAAKYVFLQLGRRPVGKCWHFSVTAFANRMSSL